jgi:hypothetical protein
MRSGCAVTGPLPAVLTPSPEHLGQDNRDGQGRREGRLGGLDEVMRAVLPEDQLHSGGDQHGPATTPTVTVAAMPCSWPAWRLTAEVSS